MFDVAGDGVVVRVHAQPGAARTEVAGVHGDALKVRVREAAEQGRANRAVEAVLADLFGVPARDVTVRSGSKARSKRVHVAGIDATAATARLDAALRR
jgi:uncharacterized protein (TIGR00251 family)